MGKGLVFCYPENYQISVEIMTSRHSDSRLTVGTRSWSRYVQMCASYLIIQWTTLVGAFEIRFRTLVYEQLETRETLTLTLTPNPNPNPNPNGKLFESDYWHASCPLYCKLADAHLYISRLEVYIPDPTPTRTRTRPDPKVGFVRVSA